MLLQIALFHSFYGWVIFHCIYVPQFNHSPADGYFCSFHVLTIVNRSVMKFGVYLSFRIMFFSGYMPRSGIARPGI